MGLSQADVGLALARVGITNILVSQFERCVLSLERMSELKPRLQRYIDSDAKLRKKVASKKPYEEASRANTTSSGTQIN